jgi:phenylalanyl-tRNA synthetase alpha chain
MYNLDGEITQAKRPHQRERESVCGFYYTLLIEQACSWAFGQGLERLAMILFGIPDIRLFWTEDRRFLDQFASGKVERFVPYSTFPPCYKDMTFWIPEAFNENDLSEIVRELAGDIVESLELIDSFTHPKTKRDSRCYRINYRHMDRSLTNQEINELQEQVRALVVQKLGVELR